jgi:putative iron-dependent peroxidase
MLGSGPEAAATVRKVAAGLPELTTIMAQRLGEPALASALGIGAGVWERLCGPDRPALLAPFEPLAENGRVAPATPADLFLHIHSGRLDANLALARAVRCGLEASVVVVEEIHGFTTQGNRDLTGFVDGTENPKGAERAGVALVGEEDAAFAGGSYVMIQRYIHDLKLWEALAVAEQEKTIGRTKETNEELEDAVKPPFSHTARVVIEENGEELEIVRHSLPYGTTSENGLYFVAYTHTPERFRRMLTRMITSDDDGHHDRLLDFTHAVTGAAFFVPSVATLARLIERT